MPGMANGNGSPEFASDLRFPWDVAVWVILANDAMGIPEYEKLSIDDFFDAISGSEVRYELVGGVAYAIASAKGGHNVICSNVQTAFVPAGKKKGCRTTSSDTAVQT